MLTEHSKECCPCSSIGPHRPEKPFMRHHFQLWIVQSSRKNKNDSMEVPLAGVLTRPTPSACTSRDRITSPSRLWRFHWFKHRRRSTLIGNVIQNGKNRHHGSLPFCAWAEQRGRVLSNARATSSTRLTPPTHPRVTTSSTLKRVPALRQQGREK